MVVYKWRHKPTGLFYQPVKGNMGNKSNLSKDGKLYHKKYNLTSDKGIMYIALTDKLETLFTELNLHTEVYSRMSSQIYSQTTPDDWEFVEFDLVERKQ